MKMMQGLTDLFSFKYIALAMLVFQNTFLILFMSASRTRKPVGDGGHDDLYASSTAVVSMELVKFFCCLVVIAYENSGGGKDQSASSSGVVSHFWTVSGLRGLWSALINDVWNKPSEMLKLSVPSFLYTVQNNLLYFALSNLDAATFQVGYQMKILTTAVFSYFMLGKRLSFYQWVSLLLLTIGVSMAQLSASNAPAGDSTKTGMNSTLGFVAVLLAAMTSGFSGVYFERILKTSPTSIWMRNVQMGFFSILIALVTVYLNSVDWAIVQRHGFFHGYDSTVIAVILLQSTGGLVVAVVVKYADNILKGFAASFSIVTSCLLSAIFLDFRPTFVFLMGAVFVNLAMYMYATYPYVAGKEAAARGSSGGGNSPTGSAVSGAGGVRSRHSSGGGSGGAPGGSGGINSYLNSNALNYLTQSKSGAVNAHKGPTGSSNPFLASASSNAPAAKSKEASDYV